MKINELHRMGAMQQYRKQSAVVHKASDRNTSKAKDQVQISSEAKELLVSDPQTSNRIEELKQSVRNGTYHVDAYQLAEKLLPILTSRK